MIIIVQILIIKTIINVIIFYSYIVIIIAINLDENNYRHLFKIMFSFF